MLKLYAAPRTRSIRIAWLLEELGLDYELSLGTFEPTPKQFFIQNTPTGKYPTIDDDGFILMESGAIIEYLLEQNSESTLMPPAGTKKQAEVLQWMHYADATAFSPLGIVIWLTAYRSDGDQHPELIEDSRQRAITGLLPIEAKLRTSDWLVGDAFSAADIMLGFTVIAAQLLGLVAENSPIVSYVERLQARPAFQRAFEKTGGYGN